MEPTAAVHHLSSKTTLCGNSNWTRSFLGLHPDRIRREPRSGGRCFGEFSWYIISPINLILHVWWMMIYHRSFLFYQNGIKQLQGRTDHGKIDVNISWLVCLSLLLKLDSSFWHDNFIFCFFNFGFEVGYDNLPALRPVFFYPLPPPRANIHRIV